MDTGICCPVEECGSEHNSVQDLSLHIRDHHQVSSNSQPVTCKIGSCKCSCLSAQRYRIHLYRFHQSYSCPKHDCNFSCKVQNDLMLHVQGHHAERTREIFVCPIEHCELVFTNGNDLTKHVSQHHGFQKNLAIHCHIDNCIHFSNDAQSFRRHFIACHRSLMDKNSFRNNSTSNIVENIDIDVGTYGDMECDDVVQDSAAQQFENMLQWVQGEVSRLKVRWKHQFHLTEQAATSLHTDLLATIESVQEKLTSALQTRLHELSVKDEILDQICCEDTFLRALHSGMKEGKILDDMGYIPPKEIVLRKTKCACQKNPDTELEICKSCSEKKYRTHYVPILDTLQSYIKHEDVFESIMRDSEDSTCLSNYTSGSVFKSHPLFSVHKNALRIVLYTDEFEVCNPIGSHKGNHKVCAVYFTVGNVESKLTSSLQSIHLALLCKWSVVKEFSYYEVFKPLLDDLKKLEDEGINVMLASGQAIHFFRTVAYVVGDNLSLNSLGGFTRCFRSGKPCRSCQTDVKDFNKIFLESQCLLRSKESYDIQQRAVLADNTLQSLYGIYFTCPLQKLDYFHPIEGLMPDIMHDILEALMCLTIKVVVKGLHSSKTLNIKKIVELIAKFKYGATDSKNKHPGITADLLKPKKSLHGSASEKWNLFKLFSLIVGPYVPEGNQHWKLYLLAAQLCEVVLSPKVSWDWIMELQDTIQLFLELWVILCPDKFPYKLHVLVHYPRQMMLYGPLRVLWTIRFKAFHLYFKEVARRCHNFRNITYTLSTRFQKKRCVEMCGSSALPPSFKPLGIQQNVSLQNLEKNARMSLTERFQCHAETPMIKMHKASVDGQIPRSASYVVLDFINDEIPVFFCIKYILKLIGNVVLYGRIRFVDHKNDHLHAYALDTSDNLSYYDVCVSVGELCSQQVASSYVINGIPYIKLSYLPLK